MHGVPNHIDSLHTIISRRLLDETTNVQCLTDVPKRPPLNEEVLHQNKLRIEDLLCINDAPTREQKGVLSER